MLGWFLLHVALGLIVAELSSRAMAKESKSYSWPAYIVVTLFWELVLGAVVLKMLVTGVSKTQEK